MANLMNTLTLITYIIIAVVGLLYCFRGERYLRVFMLIYGLYLGYTYSMRLFAAMDVAQTQWIWVVALGIGLVIGLLCFFLLKLAIFMVGGLFGLALYHAVAGANAAYFGTVGPNMSFLIGLGFFVLFGVITLLVKRHLIQIGTAFYGAYTFTDALGVIIGWFMVPSSLSPISMSSTTPYSVFSTTPSIVPWSLVVVLAILGIVVQYRGRRAKKR